MAATGRGRVSARFGVRDDPPWTVHGLTADWLTANLRGGVLRSARVVSIDAARIGEYGMSGDIWRISLRYNHDGTGAPASLVAKVATSDVGVRQIFHSMGIYEREARFYTELAGLGPVRVPDCYYASVNRASGESLLLLEDLSGLPTLGWRPHASIAEAAAVLRELASLHAAWWQNRRLEELPWLVPRGMAAIDQAQPVFERYWDVFLSKLSGPLTREITDIGPLGARYLQPVAAHLYGSAPITLIHNDVQGANVLSDRTNDFAVLLDWQQTTFGRGAMDVAHFLGGCLEPTDRRRSWDELIRIYSEMLVGGGVAGYSLDQCQVDCRLALLVSAARIAASVGAHPGLDVDPNGYWNEIFLRYAGALDEMDVADLCARIFD